MTADRVLEFTVVGVAIPKGSGRAVISRTTHRAMFKPDNPKTKGWQQTIAATAATALQRPEHANRRFTEGPIALAVVFYLPRPQRLLTKRRAPIPVAHTTKPDLDKLIRSCKDALTGVVWTDDAQVTDVIARKRYCAATEIPRAVIRVRRAESGGLHAD